MKTILSETLKERRKSLNITQGVLADLSGVSINTIVDIERGDGNPSLKSLTTVADTLGLDITAVVKKKQ